MGWLLHRILGTIEAPDVSEKEGGLARAATESPVMLASYYAPSDGKPIPLDSLDQVVRVVEGGGKKGLGDLSRIESAFREEVRTLTSNVEETNKIKRKAEVLALEERARNLLLKAAHIELAKAEQNSLYSTDNDSEFSIKAVYNLKHHGPPFRGLLAHVKLEGRKPKPTDEFYNKIKKKEQDSLERQFEGVKKEANDVLSELARCKNQEGSDEVELGGVNMDIFETKQP